MMNWKKLGIIWCPDGSKSWARTHACVPTPVRRDEKTIRVYVNSFDDRGRGVPGWVDLDAADPTKVLAEAEEPLLGLGRPGTFDDAGVLATSVFEVEPGVFYMYYGGYEICTEIRYRILTGLAISRDGGKTFKRHSEAPVLERSDEGLVIRAAPYIALEDGRFRLWYGTGSDWAEVGGKLRPVYELRYQDSADGINWKKEGVVSLPLEDGEHGYGRPFVVKVADKDYRLFCGVRSYSGKGYRMGYSVSSDGVKWKRCDQELGLDVSPGNFDGNEISYPAIFHVGDLTYCFYNGDNFGEKGFGLAVLEGSL